MCIRDRRNSIGLGTDTLIPTAQNPTAGTGLATVFTQDLWGYHSAGSNAPIYRMTSVGIGTAIPSGSSGLNIVPTASGIAGLFSGSTSGDMLRLTQTGSGLAARVDDDAGTKPFAITGNAYVGIGTTNPVEPLQIGSVNGQSSVVTGVGWVGIGITTPTVGLDVNREAYFREDVTVDGHTELNDTLNVDGAATFQDNVTINDDNKLSQIHIRRCRRLHTSRTRRTPNH